MMRRSLLSSLFVLIAITPLPASPQVNLADAAAFMNQLWHRAAELLNNKTDPAIRQAQFQQLFHDDFDGLPGLDYSLVRAKKLPRAAECPVYSLCLGFWQG